MATATSYQPKWRTEAKRLRREASIIGENIASMVGVAGRYQQRLDNSLSYEPCRRDAQDQLNVQVLPGQLLKLRADIAYYENERLVLLEKARLMEGR